MGRGIVISLPNDVDIITVTKLLSCGTIGATLWYQYSALLWFCLFPGSPNINFPTTDMLLGLMTRFGKIGN